MGFEAFADDMLFVGQFRSCVKVEVDVLGVSLVVRKVSVDVKKKTPLLGSKHGA